MYNIYIYSIYIDTAGDSMPSSRDLHNSFFDQSGVYLKSFHHGDAANLGLPLVVQH